jgi:hypothetical protein
MIGPRIVWPGIATRIDLSDLPQICVLEPAPGQEISSQSYEFERFGVDIAGDAIGPLIDCVHVFGKPGRTGDTIGVRREDDAVTR